MPSNVKDIFENKHRQFICLLVCMVLFLFLFLSAVVKTRKCLSTSRILFTLPETIFFQRRLDMIPRYRCQINDNPLSNCTAFSVFRYLLRLPFPFNLLLNSNFGFLWRQLLYISSLLFMVANVGLKTM